jgi:hypothetical protein
MMFCHVWFLSIFVCVYYCCASHLVLPGGHNFYVLVYFVLYANSELGSISSEYTNGKHYVSRQKGKHMRSI